MGDGGGGVGGGAGQLVTGARNVTGTGFPTRLQTTDSTVETYLVIREQETDTGDHNYRHLSSYRLSSRKHHCPHVLYLKSLILSKKKLETKFRLQKCMGDTGPGHRNRGA